MGDVNRSPDEPAGKPRRHPNRARFYGGDLPEEALRALERYGSSVPHFRQARLLDASQQVDLFALSAEAGEVIVVQAKHHGSTPTNFRLHLGKEAGEELRADPDLRSSSPWLRTAFDALQSPFKRSATKPPRLHSAPGYGLLRIAEFLYSRNTYESVFQPTIDDLQAEYAEALSQERRWKARWVRARGYWSFLSAVSLQSIFGVGKCAAKIWKIVT